MTGPAVLIPVFAAVLTTAAHAGGFDWWRIPVSILHWWLSTLAVFAAGYLLSRKGTCTRTVRTLVLAILPSVVVMVTAIVAFILLAGAGVTLEALLQDVGLLSGS
jgi:hypothetical protein